MAGAAGASSVHGNSSSTDTVSGKKADYGQYTIWWDANAATIGRQEDAPNAGSFDRMQDCMTACDYDRKCAGITVQSTLHEGSNYNNVGPKTCKLIYGDDRFGQYKRTVIRADPSKVEIPVYMRGEARRQRRRARVGWGGRKRGKQGCDRINRPRRQTRGSI